MVGGWRIDLPPGAGPTGDGGAQLGCWISAGQSDKVGDDLRPGIACALLLVGTACNDESHIGGDAGAATDAAEQVECVSDAGTYRRVCDWNPQTQAYDGNCRVVCPDAGPALDVAPNGLPEVGHDQGVSRDGWGDVHAAESGPSANVDAPAQDDGLRADAGPSCVTDDDCPTGLACGYPVAERCAALGVCVVPNCADTACNSPGGACGCDGKPVEPVQMERTPTGGRLLYTSRPYRGIGPCQ